MLYIPISFVEVLCTKRIQISFKPIKAHIIAKISKNKNLEKLEKLIDFFLSIMLIIHN